MRHHSSRKCLRGRSLYKLRPTVEQLEDRVLLSAFNGNFRDMLLFAAESIDVKSGADIVAAGSRSVGDLVVGNGSVANDKDTELTIGANATTSAGSNLVADGD